MATQLGAGRLIGHRVLDNQGSSVGKIGEVYYDDESDAAKWVTVRTGLFGTRESFVPLEGASEVEDDIQVPYDKQTIKDAPHFDVGRRISADEEMRIFQHYGISRSGVPGQRGSSEDLRADETASGTAGAGAGMAAGTGTAASEGGTGDATAGTAEAETGASAAETGTMGVDTGMAADTRTAGAEETGAGPQAGTAGTAGAETAMSSETALTPGREEASMTRFEERVHVGRERAESGRVHLRKHVDTEEFQETVPLVREELTVERGPVESSGLGDTRMDADDQEIILYEEHATVSKEPVPVEHVRVIKNEVTEEQTVRGERHKERVELEDENFQEPLE